jgi:hypothetical protein
MKVWQGSELPPALFSIYLHDAVTSWKANINTELNFKYGKLAILSCTNDHILRIRKWTEKVLLQLNNDIKFYNLSIHQCSTNSFHSQHTLICQTHDGTPQNLASWKGGYETIQGHKYVSTYKSLPSKNADIGKQNITHVE